MIKYVDKSAVINNKDQQTQVIVNMLDMRVSALYEECNKKNEEIQDLDTQINQFSKELKHERQKVVKLEEQLNKKKMNQSVQVEDEEIQNL